eukprot:CAMPEP_0181303284 /NCGR_PEP_ID=MMETSP1101-20121128/8467_1 /TAXON_ID=46948 /ORGANISM="Rhodomonas abbreviata, Strain Caron Lab Isolate" /LENGTH=272 /DNA_ID=CAMNT_0023408829 /DNA_START=213 /DNA_END=1031 /DNA_ORIENTATION=+
MSAVQETNTQDMREFSCETPPSRGSGAKMVSFDFDDFPRVDSSAVRDDAGLAVGSPISLQSEISSPSSAIPNTQDMREFSCGAPQKFKRKASRDSGAKMVSLDFDFPRVDSSAVRDDAGLAVGPLMSLDCDISSHRSAIPNRARHNRRIGLLLHKESISEAAIRNPSTNEPEEHEVRLSSSESSSSFTSIMGSVSGAAARSLHNRSIGLLLMEEEMGAEGFDFSKPAGRSSSLQHVEDWEEEIEFSLSDFGFEGSEGLDLEDYVEHGQGCGP